MVHGREESNQSQLGWWGEHQAPKFWNGKKKTLDPTSRYNACPNKAKGPKLDKVGKKTVGARSPSNEKGRQTNCGEERPKEPPLKESGGAGTREVHPPAGV